MKWILRLILLCAWVSAADANEEITVDLPGGATMEFVWIEPGTFIMGSPSSESRRQLDEGPQHEVTISHGFYLGKPEKRISQLCQELRVTRTTLYRYVEPQGELRDHGKQVLALD